VDIVLTDHAQRRMIRRGIRIDWVRDVVLHPESILDDDLDDTVEHRLAIVPEAAYRLLRVVVARDSHPARVVTAYFVAMDQELP